MPPPVRGFKSLMAGALLLVLSPILLMKGSRSGTASFLGARRLGRQGKKSRPWRTAIEGTVSKTSMQPFYARLHALVQQLMGLPLPS